MKNAIVRILNPVKKETTLIPSVLFVNEQSIDFFQVPLGLIRFAGFTGRVETWHFK